MTTLPPVPLSDAGHRCPAEIASLGVWLCFRFPLSPRHVDESLPARDHLAAKRDRAARVQAFQACAELTNAAGMA